MPSYLSSLQAPYRVHCHPAMQSLVSEYGATAVRLWILAIANSGILYSTNPSTLSSFLDDLATDWQKSARLIQDWCRNPEVFGDVVHAIANRLDSCGSRRRLERIAESNALLPLEICAPAVETYICWVGGYVKPFLDRLAARLPRNRYQLMPMYSMSTETLETVGYFTGNKVAFLPIAPRVLYEFIEEGPKTPTLLTANQLRAGKTYSMIVSDPYGLRRYQTGDLFLCRGFAGGLPDLSFVGRRGLEYSFTGEKLTANHVMIVFQKLRGEYPQLGAGRFLTCVPSHPREEAIPHYKIVMVNEHQERVRLPIDEVAKRCNDLLGGVNSEYQSKFESGRLGRVRFVSLSQEEFLARVCGPQEHRAWEAQFKFLPLYQSTWESFQT